MLHHYFNDTSCSKETYSQSAAINKGMKHWSKVLFSGACMQQMFALHSAFPLVFYLTFSNRSYIHCTLYRKRFVKTIMLRVRNAQKRAVFPCIFSPPWECGCGFSQWSFSFPHTGQCITNRSGVQRLWVPGGADGITRETVNQTQRARLVFT